MWTSSCHQVNAQTTKFTLNGSAEALSFRTVLELWSVSAEFRKFFSASIRASSFDAFFWETPPVTNQTLDRDFEFVLVHTAALSRLRPDPSPFQAHFLERQDVLTFPNLGGDAILVVPAPLAEQTCYTHLALFLRGAPPEQVSALWRAAGLAMRERISGQPVWLSTAGLGVSWLHLRLDSRPKYYRHLPYTTNGLTTRSSGRRRLL